MVELLSITPSWANVVDIKKLQELVNKWEKNPEIS